MSIKYLILTFKYIINYILEEAYKYCESITKNHYENFPVASLFIPKNKRKYIYSIYAFARLADDIADSGELTSVQKINKLEIINNELNDCYKNISNNVNSGQKKIFTALANTATDLDIPKIEFDNLLTAFKQDAVKQRYNEFDELIEYSTYSANPIGHLVLNTFGFHSDNDSKIFKLSDKICTGLQLINFWQDVKRDIEIDRIYIPLRVMEEFNYTEDLLRDNVENDDFLKMIEYLIDKTSAIIEQGSELEKMLKGRLRLELKAIYLGGQEIIRKIKQKEFRVLSNRIEINRFDKLKLLLKIL